MCYNGSNKYLNWIFSSFIRPARAFWLAERTMKWPTKSVSLCVTFKVFFDNSWFDWWILMKFRIYIRYSGPLSMTKNFLPPTSEGGGEGDPMRGVNCKNFRNWSNWPMLMKFRTCIRLIGPCTDTEKFLSPTPPFPLQEGLGLNFQN